MSRSRRSETRVTEHWWLLAIILITLFVGLLAQGYARHTVGAASTANRDHSRPVDGIASVGPIIDLSGKSIRSVAPPDHTVALTFDDGPDPRWTPEILSVLAAQHVSATFFDIGSEVAAHPGIVAREFDQGNDVGNHTFTHTDLAELPGWQASLELRLTQVAFASAIGRHIALLRPPYSSEVGAVRTDTLRAWRSAAKQGYLIVVSTRDSEDWRPTSTVDGIVRQAMPERGAGAIILLHDGGGDRHRTVAAVGELIRRLRAQQYRFVKVSELLHAQRDVVMPSVSGAEHLQADALPIALRVGGWFADCFTILAIAIGALAVIRAFVLVVAARRHKRNHPRYEPTFTPPVSILIPAYNEAPGIEAAVLSLASSQYPDFEIVVVDDGSTDATAELVERLIATRGLSHVRLVRQTNRGKSGALNVALRHTRGEIVVTVDGDTVFERDALAALVRPFSCGEVGAVSGNTKVANRGGLLGRWQHLEYIMGFNLDRRLYDLAGCMPTVPGAIGAFRRAALDEVHGFSDDTLAEDTDLTMALHRAGWRVVYEEGAIAWTEAPSSLRDLWRQRYRWSYGTIQSVWKHRRAVTTRGPGRRLGWIGIPYLLVFQVGLTLLAPVVDVFALYGILFLDPWTMLGFWIGFNLLGVGIAWYALSLDGESHGPLWSLPLQQIVYRQLMYLVVLQSTATALTGTRTGWHKITRAGAIRAHEPENFTSTRTGARSET
jgi:cellulose synthase/poly-beta-1,6-N-acetylglucosamine synthase-like glycosyltransferase/peptidoglycan/xylan/chitin deacetylase (PgdA/CDA1 family)